MLGFQKIWRTNYMDGPLRSFDQLQCKLGTTEKIFFVHKFALRRKLLPSLQSLIST